MTQSLAVRRRSQTHALGLVGKVVRLEGVNVTNAVNTVVADVEAKPRQRQA